MRNKLDINTQNGTVIKHFRSRIAAEKERYILTSADGENLTPRLYGADERSITMEYIPGTLLSDVLRCADVPHIIAALDALFAWVEDFGRYFRGKTGEYIVLDDFNPRNFIYDGKGKITGIDFEAWHRGDARDNVISLLVMIKTSDFADDSIKTAVFDRMLTRCATILGEDAVAVENSVEKASRAVYNRRKAMPAVRKSDCVVIAGGRSSRMGQDKALLMLDGYTFIDRVIYNASIFDDVYISANGGYASLGCDIIRDVYKDIGPLGALHAALDACPKKWVFFIPCDMPFVSQKTMLQLYTTVCDDADAIIFTAEGRVFPTLGVYRKTALPAIENAVKSGNYRLMNVLSQLKTRFVEAEHPEELKNINTPEDYAALT